MDSSSSSSSTGSFEVGVVGCHYYCARLVRISKCLAVQTTIQDVVQIPPNRIHEPAATLIEDSINQKYANKVIQKVGLCISFYDLLHATDGLIGQGTGIVNVNVKFRMLVFRPFRGEILEGKIAQATSKHMRLTVDFFDDILVECPTGIFESSRFDATEAVWIWNSDGSDFFFDKHEKVRFRIDGEVWQDQMPAAPVNLAPTEAKDNDVIESEEHKAEKSPWRIMASMNGPGLGPMSWWVNDPEAEDEPIADSNE